MNSFVTRCYMSFSNFFRPKEKQTETKPSHTSDGSNGTPGSMVTLADDEVHKLSHQFYSQIFRCPLNAGLLDPAMKLQLDQLASQLLTNKEYRVKSTPRMPAILPQLMRCLKDETANKQQFVELIKQDAAIAAAVLKSANSVLYNPSGRKVDSFDRAVVILGIGGLKSIVCTAMLQPVSQSKDGNEQLTKQLWAHSLRTGICAQMFAHQFEIDPFTAYLVGLFHSIGALTLNTQLNLWDFANIREEAHSFLYLKKQCADSLSLEILAQWELPEDIQTAMKFELTDPQAKLLKRSASFSQLVALYEKEKINDDEFDALLDQFELNRSFSERVSQLTQETLKAQG